MEKVKGTWCNKSLQSDVINALEKAEKEYATLQAKAREGDFEAYEAANLIAIRIRSLKDRLQGKAKKVFDFGGVFTV